MADSIPVILSRARPGQGDHARLEEPLIEALTGRPGVALHVVPHLYDLSPDGPGAGLLRSIPGPMIVLAWLYPRSAFWVLDAHGVKGRPGQAASLPDDEPGRPPSHVNAPGLPERTIWCCDLRAHDRAEPYVAEIARIVGASVEQVGPEAPAAAAPPHVIDEATRPRWYPVVDYGRCTNCLECLNFCIFGVYGLDESERIVAEEPDACRPGCPACARICPAGAIMFPEHADPAIAGDPNASAEGLKLDLSQLFGGADPTQLAAGERDRALSEKHRRETQSSSDEATPPAPKDDLDRLVDEVDDLDL
ncbi:MAG TPA: ferredoxin family protein [Thermoguttaceae bacterium]|nr:ferredoxin family protein [Thermoguttaceae bacterium]